MRSRCCVKAEERFCLVANTAPVLIWMCSPEGQTTYSNDRLFEFTGKSPDGCKYGNTWEDFVHPDDFARVTQALSGALKNREPFSKEYRLRRRDGVSRGCSISLLRGSMETDRLPGLSDRRLTRPIRSWLGKRWNK